MSYREKPLAIYKRNSDGLLDPQEEDRSQRAKNRAQGVPRAASTFPRKKETRENVSEQGTTWCRKVQATSFFGKLCLIGCQLIWDGDVWTYFFSCMLTILKMRMLSWQDWLAQSLLWDGAPGASQIELIQLSARCQDLYSGMKTSSLTSGAMLCWHGLKALRKELLLCPRAGFYGNNHLGLGQVIRFSESLQRLKTTLCLVPSQEQIFLFPDLASDSHWQLSVNTHASALQIHPPNSSFYQAVFLPSDKTTSQFSRSQSWCALFNFWLSCSGSLFTTGIIINHHLVI